MRPSARLCWLAAVLSLLTVVAALFALPKTPVLVISAGAILFALFDALMLYRRQLPLVQRELPAMVPVKRPFQGELQLQFTGGGRISGELLEQCPEGMRCDSHCYPVVLGPEVLTQAMEYMAQRRGSMAWQWLQWTERSKFSLWQRRSLLPCASQLAVYPDYASSRRQLSISLSRSLRELGVVQRQRAGDSQEFHQLRAYQRGDSLRQIDWKATSRKRQLIARQYTEESNQSLVLMLDCGRRMSLRHGQRELLDEAMDATLMAAEVALRQGDKVSVQCFASEPFYWSGLNRTPQAISTMLAQLHDIHCRLEASDYVAAAQALRKTLKQRSTVVIVTHSRNENMDELNMAARLLGDKHRVVVADISDGEMQSVLEEEPVDFDRALSYSGALEYRRKRRDAQSRLRSLGTDVMDVRPHQLVSALVQAYHSHRGTAA